MPVTRGRKKVTLLIPLAHQAVHPLNYREPYKLITLKWSWYQEAIVQRAHTQEYYALIRHLGLKPSFFTSIPFNQRCIVHHTWAPREVYLPYPDVDYP